MKLDVKIKYFMIFLILTFLIGYISLTFFDFLTKFIILFVYFLLLLLKYEMYALLHIQKTKNKTLVYYRALITFFIKLLVSDNNKNKSHSNRLIFKPLPSIFCASFKDLPFLKKHFMHLQ